MYHASRRISPAISVLAVVLLSGAARSSARNAVHAESDPAVDIAQFGSFAVVLGTSWQSPICERRTIGAIERELEATGRTRVDEASADLLIVVHGTTKEKTALHSFYDGWPGWRWRGWGYGGLSTHVQEYTERTLVVDAFRRDGKLLVWRGTARGVAASDPQRNHARLEKAIGRMFDEFPRGNASASANAPREEARA